MTQSFLGSFAKAQKSYQKGRVFPLDQFWEVFLNPTNLVGFICPIKKVGLILCPPRNFGSQKKYPTKKVGLKISY
jgi:hypothetical protein